MADSFQVTLRSPLQILGDLVRTMLANSDLTDVSPGSTLATLLEAIASSEYEISLSALKILQSTDLESLVGAQLDKKAQSIRLPNGIGGYGRLPASQSSGNVTIGSAFQKISSKLYSGQPAPFAGSSTLFLENASSFPATGSVYLGRGTLNRFEGPIPYTSVVNNGSFWTLTLSADLTKSHLASDLVVVAQGGDRTVSAGTIVQVPPNSSSPAVQYATAQDLVIPDGESTGSVGVVCTQFGEVGNALAGGISQFASQPFAGATVTNPTNYQNGQSTESDEDLRQRIKNYPSTLSRGTEAAILAAILGAQDPATGRTIQSAVVLEPVEPGDYARVYIDDGTGLEPTFGDQAYELLLQSASGQEVRFRTSQFPITPAVAIGANDGPFAIQADQAITVHVDELVETYTITPSNYANLNAATGYEIVRDLNSQSNIVGWRTANNGTNIVMIDLSGIGETMSIELGTLQGILGLPTATLRPIFLYKDSKIQSFRGHTGTLSTRPFNEWSLVESDLENVEVIVDGVTQTITITDADFAPYQATIATSTISQWASVLTKKVAGVQFTVSGQILVWSTWQALSATGSVTIPATRADGTPAGWVGASKMWLPTTLGGVLSDTGYAKDFQFNRFTGEINFLTKPAAGDTIEIGSNSTRAHLRSTVTSNGLYDLSPLTATVGDARIVVAFDGQFEIRSSVVAPGDTITPTQPDATNATNIIRLTSSGTSEFENALVGDWMYLIQDQSTVPAWGADVEGFYRLKAVGLGKYATNQTYTGLAATGYGIVSVTAAVLNGRSTVTVSQSSHGLSTGDLITVITATAIGGISGANLSVTNQAVVVLDANTFQYTALANATSDASGLLAAVTTNLITVTQVAHGFSSGALITTVVTSGFAGISAGNLSVTAQPIQFVNANSYIYRASASSSSSPVPAGGNINTVTYIADTWVEFEVSSPQLSAWTPLLGAPQTLTANMIYIFESTSQPQLVDFGNSVSTLTVDQAVAAINASIAAGEAVKITPQQLEIHSSDYSLNGSAAVLAVIGNASNLLSTGTSTSQQAHTAFADSGNTQASTPVVSSIMLPTEDADGYGTRTYLVVDRDLTNIVDRATNPTIQTPSAFAGSYPIGFQELWLTGRQSGLGARLYNNETTAPFTGLMRGQGAIRPVDESDTVQDSSGNLDRYANYGLRFRDLGFNNFDKLVVEMDLDAIDDTVAIQLSKRAIIQDMEALTGNGPGQVISFRLQDPDNSNLAFFDPTSVYAAYDFSDFKMLTKSVGLYQTDVSDRALVLRSADYAANHRLRLSIQLPTTSAQAAIQITHINDYLNGEARLNLVAVLPSQALVAGSVLATENYRVQSTPNGTLYDWRITAGTLNSGSQYVPGNVLNISGVSNLSGSYQITAASYHTWSGASAATTATSNVVTVTQANHGFLNGDYVDVTASAPIGGISAANLSGSYSITFIDANTFSYQAGASATSGATGTLTLITGGAVTVKSPGSGGLAPAALYNAASSPVASWPIAQATLQDLANAVNAYYPTYPVATGQAIGTNIATNYIVYPTYLVYPPAVAYTGTDMTGAFEWSSFNCNLSGSAGIWQYDSSVPANNGVKATVQSMDSIFPTTTQASGTTYSPIGEVVYLVPTNTNTLQRWLNFNASSSLNLLANIDRIQSDTVLQISSQQEGSAGAVEITGVTANSIESAIIGNATTSENSIVVDILTADAKAMVANSMVRLQNTIASERLRPYRLVPTGSSITEANTVDVNTFFRQTNALLYLRVNLTTGRLLFLRNGQGPSQTEPLASGNTIQFTSLTGGLVQVTSALASGAAGSGKLSARVGDMMYIQPNPASSFSIDQQCKEIATTGISDGTQPEYPGFPVAYVIDDYNIVIIAPTITTFNTVTLASATDLIFMPAIWNEKNIRTNRAEGTNYGAFINNGNAYYLVKSLGSGFVSVWLQNSAHEATDDMKLNTMSVGADDLAVLGEGFDPANQGTFRIVAHNGRNHLVIYNPGGGKDELINMDILRVGGTGERKWRVGPLNDGDVRPIRILAGESVQLGDNLRISTPSALTQWFNSTFFGTWAITKIGFCALDFTSASLPYTTSSGTYSAAKLCPYIEFLMPNGAPLSVTDSSNNPVGAFLVGANDTAIGFVEGTPYQGVRMVAGHGVNPQNAENTDVFLVPNYASEKMSSTFGTVMTIVGKAGYLEQTFQGIDGYKIFTGLVQQAHRIIDSLPTNTVLFPGVKAAGAIIEVLPPLIRSISVSLAVNPTDGVTLNSITQLVQSTVAGYINGLGVGQPVVLAEIVRQVQSLPGVFSVTILSTLPAASTDRIVVGTIEKPFVINATSDISLG